MFDQEAVDSAHFHWTAQAGRPFMPAAMAQASRTEAPTTLLGRVQPEWPSRQEQSTPLVTREVIREYSAQVR